MGKAIGYTQPSWSMAFVLAKVVQNPHRMDVNLASPICDILKYVQGKRWQRDQFINAPHILIRLIYFALGMLDQIPHKQEQQFLMEQVNLVHEIDKVEKKRKRKREK